MSALLDRFLRYARIDTQADDRTTAYPSSPGQLVLGAMLRDELRALGLDARQDEHGLVFATVPGNVPGAPTIAFNAHVDTNPENSGKDVNPQVIRAYAGGDITLPKDPSKVIRVADNPELTALVGKTIITTDGTTLLGADDKAGLAVIMEAVRTLVENPGLPHGPVAVVFTCDEEIGRGVLHLEPAMLGGAVAAYTLDGAGTAEIEDETFSADAATVTITGVNIHPSIAKGRMTNAIRLAGMFLDRLPKRRLSPETTAGRDGFLHPLTIDGGVGEVKIGFLLRDFDTPQLAVQAELLREIGRQVEREYPEAKVTVEVRKQYRNMRDGIAKEPRAIAYAAEAVKRAGMEPKFKIIRGGTDGAMLTEKGLPTPNLSTGEHNPHSPLEWTCLEEMEAAVRVVVELCGVWAGR
ncbi:peptidase T [Urbifossiella limnaea]|uniref:Peptidase T n=1 Tax=Urbifossiella limnaea TaxID=2528023 RepID=A0A517XMQ3_9BACT|nr:peptidase T [Urbifossiella limnaea]QDU18788.1 Peptidase T [Urbifossiella limnaea]